VTQGCFEAVKMCMSGGSSFGSSSVPTRTNFVIGPEPAQWLQTATLHTGHRAICCPDPLSEGV